nr:family 16 glycoside hydrolase [Rhodopirellula sp. SM50]
MQRLHRTLTRGRMMFAALVAAAVVATVTPSQQATAQQPSAEQPSAEQASTEQAETAGQAPAEAAGGEGSENSAAQNGTAAKNSADKSEKTAWISLAGHWKACQFGGEGDVIIKDDVIKMEHGDPLTGVVWTGPFDGDSSKTGADDSKSKNAGPLPRDNYELRWECRRDSGYDFLCAFTFPVADQYVSLVMGGWGGGITGISSIDGRDASDNETTMFMSYEDKKWYSARVRVETAKITAWVDGTELFSHPRKDHEFDIRFEMDPCTPLGIANFECDSQIRNIQLRRLHASEITAAK